MRRRHKPGAYDKYKSYTEYDIDIASDVKKQIAQFKGDSPLFLEIGAGRANFAIDLAFFFPEAKVIAVELKEELLLYACERTREMKLTNIKFIRGKLENIDDWIEPDSVDKIFINFCDPWPKKRHYKKRLTYAGFLSAYKRILKPIGEIQFKSDQEGLYDFTLEEMDKTGFIVLDKTRDHIITDDSNLIETIMTDYERKFRSLGNPIYKIIAVSDGKPSENVEEIPHVKHRREECN